jgi:hypothetical protein
MTVAAADAPGDLALAVVMSGEPAQRVKPGLKNGAEVRVKGSLKAVRRPLRSGLRETAYEVIAELIELDESGRQGN